MVFRFFYIVRHQILKGQHTIDIQIAGACDQVFLIGILGGQLIADQVAAVVQIFSIYEIIFGHLPARWLHLADGAALFCRHQVRSNTGIRCTTAAKFIQVTVIFKRFTGQIRLCKIRDIAVYNCIRFSRVGRNSRKIHVNIGAGASRTGCSTSRSF